MLVLRRKVDETIILDGIISISVLAIEGDRVKIGIQAPPGVRVVRGELLEATGLPEARPGEVRTVAPPLAPPRLMHFPGPRSMNRES